MGATKLHRQSIPQNLYLKVLLHFWLTLYLLFFSQGDITKFMKELMKNSSEWKTMKIVILGHGRIGKTTLLRALKSQLAQHSTVRSHIHLDIFRLI